MARRRLCHFDMLPLACLCHEFPAGFDSICTPHLINKNLSLSCNHHAAHHHNTCSQELQSKFISQLPLQSVWVKGQCQKVCHSEPKNLPMPSRSFPSNSSLRKTPQCKSPQDSWSLGKLCCLCCHPLSGPSADLWFLNLLSGLMLRERRGK